MLVFVGGEKLVNPEKNLSRTARTNNKLKPHLAAGWNQTQARFKQAKPSQHCAHPPPQLPVTTISSQVHLKILWIMITYTHKKWICCQSKCRQLINHPFLKNQEKQQSNWP